jgi:hypothetical protein
MESLSLERDNAQVSTRIPSTKNTLFAIMTTMTICIGGVMAAQQYQEPFVQAHAGAIEPVQRLRGASVAGLRHEQPDQGPEEEWHERFRSLQRCICELLIKNQQLRMALESTTNHQAEEAYQ